MTTCGMTTKKPYQQPVCLFFTVQYESHILKISAETTSPKEGNDPTGGNPSTPNPFKPNTAKRQWFDMDE